MNDNFVNKDKNQSEIVLLKNSHWNIIDGEPCRVIDFVPMGVIKDGKVLSLNKTTSYASVRLECSKLSGREITGFICHKLDFIHLWKAFKERGIKPNEEVIIYWSAKHYKNKLYKFLSFLMPKLWVMICPKGAFELITNPNLKPELTGEARAKAELPIMDWKPEVMI